MPLRGFFVYRSLEVLRYSSYRMVVNLTLFDYDK
nr:MAG TPA: hypothetical protein [Caudoviricetes sp.]